LDIRRQAGEFGVCGVAFAMQPMNNLMESGDLRSGEGQRRSNGFANAALWPVTRWRIRATTRDLNIDRDV